MNCEINKQIPKTTLKKLSQIQGSKCCPHDCKAYTKRLSLSFRYGWSVSMIAYLVLLIKILFSFDFILNDKTKWLERNSYNGKRLKVQKCMGRVGCITGQIGNAFKCICSSTLINIIIKF